MVSTRVSHAKFEALPIANLTSQFFANVYLDPLDQSVKHRLKARYYLRDCDDLVPPSADRTQPEYWERQLEAFLAERALECRWA